MKTKTFVPTKTISLQELLKPFFEEGNDIKIQCMECGNIHHNIDSEDFIAIQGNICIGLFGGMVGNNFDSAGRLGRISFLCRSKHCLSSFMKRFMGIKKLKRSKEAK